jgi:hypothetical protein
VSEVSSAETDPCVECQPVGSSDQPLRQGDVLEWLDPEGSFWREHAIVVTADCDLAHQKHGGVLACVPVLGHETYLALFPLPVRLDTARSKLLERAVKAVREHQAANVPDFPTPMSSDTIAHWIDATHPVDVVATLGVSSPKDSTRLEALLISIRECSSALAAGGFERQLHALARAQMVAQGTDDFETRRSTAARDMLDRLSALPGDAVFLHSLSPTKTEGYVVYLRTVINIQEDAVATNVPALRSGTVSAKRIARLTSPYIFHITQQLGQVFSAIGLPAPYETSRAAFIETRATGYKGST